DIDVVVHSSWSLGLLVGNSDLPILDNEPVERELLRFLVGASIRLIRLWRRGLLFGGRFVGGWLLRRARRGVLLLRRTNRCKVPRYLFTSKVAANTTAATMMRRIMIPITMATFRMAASRRAALSFASWTLVLDDFTPLYVCGYVEFRPEDRAR